MTEENDYDARVNTIEGRRFQCVDGDYEAIDKVALMLAQEGYTQLPIGIRLAGIGGSSRTLGNGELRLVGAEPSISYITSKVGRQVLDADPTRPLELEARLYIGESGVCGGGYDQPMRDVAIIAKNQRDASEFIAGSHFNETPVSFVQVPVNLIKTTYWKQGSDRVILTPPVIQKYQEQRQQVKSE